MLDNCCRQTYMSEMQTETAIEATYNTLFFGYK